MFIANYQTLVSKHAKTCLVIVVLCIITIIIIIFFFLNQHASMVPSIFSSVNRHTVLLAQLKSHVKWCLAWGLFECVRCSENVFFQNDCRNRTLKESKDKSGGCWWVTKIGSKQHLYRTMHQPTKMCSTWDEVQISFLIAKCFFKKLFVRFSAEHQHSFT